MTYLITYWGHSGQVVRVFKHSYPRDHLIIALSYEVIGGKCEPILFHVSFCGLTSYLCLMMLICYILNNTQKCSH